MAGPPPPGPPKLSYKSRREREEEERKRREEEEEEQRRRKEEEAERRRRFKAEQRAREEQKRERYLAARKVARGVPRALYGVKAPGPAPSPLEAKPPEEEAPEPAEAPEPGLPPMIELPTGAAAPEVEEEAPPAPPPRRMLPPRPPKSPDMRPVWAGFLLVGVGTAQLLWGIYTMARAPWVGEGRWADAVEWAAFAAGFSAAVLGLFAVRGGMWSFRKERYDRVLWGAVCGTICFWALWVPWLVGFIALLIVHAAKLEYYPHYDPARDAPEWAKPPTRERDEEEEGDETEDEEGGEQASEGASAAPTRG